MPKFLLEDEFEKLSVYARYLYMLLKDRHELSMKNKWYNDKEEVYIIMRREEMEKLLKLSPLKIRKVLKELKDFNLIEEEIRGLNKPNLIYLLEYSVLTFREVKTEYSGIFNFNRQDYDDITPNHTNLINHTNLSNTNISINQGEVKNYTPYSPNDSIDSIKIAVKNKISLNHLQLKYPNKQKELHELYEIIVEILLSKKTSFRISKENMPAAAVKEAFAVLDYAQIEYVLECLGKNTTKVKNTKAYLQTALFNATKTINNHYDLDSQNFMFEKFGIEPK